MSGFPVPSLWAVHLSDVLAPAWVVGGFALAAVLLALAAWRLREEEIPQTVLLASAFFVASQIHVKVGPSSVHLLLNGLVGVVLGRLAPPWRSSRGCFSSRSLLPRQPQFAGRQYLCDDLAGAVGGSSSCRCTGAAGYSSAWFAAVLVFVSGVLLALSLAFCGALLWKNGLTSRAVLELEPAVRVVLHPATLAVAAVLGAVAVYLERRLENAPEFSLGFLLGEMAVLLTLLLNAVVLVWGGLANWHTLAVVLFVVHLPLAVIEGVVLGFVVGFLTRVKPELLGLSPDPSLEDSTCVRAPLA